MRDYKRLQMLTLGSLWLYFSIIVEAVSWFAYWLLVSRLAGKEVLGYTSAIIGTASLITDTISLGIGVGLQRFLGEYLARSDIERARLYLWTALVFNILLHVPIGVVFIVLGLLGYSIGDYTPVMLILIGLFVSVGFIHPFTALYYSELRTGLHLFAVTTGNILRIIVTVTLITKGFGWSGTVIGYTMYYILYTSLGLLYAVKRLGFRLVLSWEALRNVLEASLAGWAPYTLVLAGQWAGVVALYSSASVTETGDYYIALTITTAVYAIPNTVLALLIPVLSGMDSGRDELALTVLRQVLALTYPVAIAVAAYPTIPLKKLGNEYATASLLLTLLALSTLLAVFPLMLVSLLYAYKEYRRLLVLGLVQNASRLALYSILVPLMKSLGAAIAYTVGSLAGLLYSLHISRSMGLKLPLKEAAVVAATAGGVAVVARILNMPWPIGVALILSTILATPRLRIVSREEVVEAAKALLPEWVLSRIKPVARILLDLVAPDDTSNRRSSPGHEASP